MANTSVVYARINSDIKREGESVLAELGISPSSAIQMFYRQLITDRALPFTPHLPEQRPLNISTLTRTQIDGEIAKAAESLSAGEGIPEEAADVMFSEEFGI